MKMEKMDENFEGKLENFKKKISSLAIFAYSGEFPIYFKTE